MNENRQRTQDQSELRINDEFEIHINNELLAEYGDPVVLNKLLQARIDAMSPLARQELGVEMKRRLDEGNYRHYGEN